MNSIDAVFGIIAICIFVLGAFFGMLVSALLVAAGRADDEAGRPRG